MNKPKEYFRNIQQLSVQLTSQCNIKCPYCYQNAGISKNIEYNSLPSPEEFAANILRFLNLYSKNKNFDIVLSGGEPLLVPLNWIENFICRLLENQDDKQIRFVIQSNASLINSKVINLAKKYSIQFSLHYDGENINSALKSETRLKNIERLRQNDLLMTCLIVGTTEALNNLIDTVNFFKKNDIRHYRLNYISEEGRKDCSIIPTSKQRAEAEFELAVHAFQNNFKIWEHVILNKFVQFVLNEGVSNESISLPKPQDCNAGVTHVYIDKDGNVYPCSFFSDITGTIANIYDEKIVNENYEKGVSLCTQKNDFYEKQCVSCVALPICREYCSLSPTSNNNFITNFCNTQKYLYQIMAENIVLTRLIGNFFLKHIKKYPEQEPKSCGQI